jgi:hypothetical protein
MIGRVLGVAVVLAIVTVALGGQVAHAGTTIAVPADQPTIQAALDVAVSGDTRGRAIPQTTVTRWLEDAARIEDVMGCQ